MTPRRHANVVNVDELAPMERGKGRFGPKGKRLGAAAGAKGIGFNWMELAPGKTSFPFHFHTGIEEGLFVLSGAGQLRIGSDTVDVRAGDYAAFPVGPAHAHNVTNTGTEPLRYVVLSNQNTTDICGYPDSKKFGFWAIPDPTQWPNGFWVRKMVKEQPDADYFEGEDTGE